MRQLGKFIRFPWRALGKGLGGLALLVCTLEVAALGYVSRQDGVFFYARPRSAGVGSDGGPPESVPRKVLHPVLGIINPPSLPVARAVSPERLEGMVGQGAAPGWLSLKANNYGFFADVDYPTAPATDDAYLIGVFGGSAAQWFALQGADRLRERLRESGVLQGRQVRILPFAQGGFKQPQQVLTLAYFLALGQRLDFVVNIDGFNEAALSFLNVTRGMDMSLPSSQNLLPLVAMLGGASASRHYLETALRAKNDARRLAALDALSRENRSAAVEVLLRRLKAVAARRYWRSSLALDEASSTSERTPLIHLNEAAAPEGAADPGVLSRIADLWMRSSILMQAQAQANGARYLHVIQPNQYASGRTFSGQERAIAIDPASPYAVPVREGYPLFIGRLPLLGRNGVRAVDGGHVFDGVRETVYADSCCHYNQLGNELLADLVAAEMVSAIADDGEALRTGGSGARQ